MLERGYFYLSKKERVKWNIDKVKDFVEVESDCRLMSTVYKNNRTPLTFQCKCDEFFNTNLFTFINSHTRQCDKCDTKDIIQKRKQKYAEIIKFVKDASECTILSTEYISSNHHLTFRCKCGEKFNATWNNFTNNNKRQCNECGDLDRILNKTKSHVDFVNEIQELYGGEFECLEHYVSTHSEIKIKHIICGKVFKAKPSNLRRKGEFSKCPTCSEQEKIQSGIILKGVCDYCGTTEGAYYGRFEGVEYCSKHLQQLHTKGELLERTRKDGNTYKINNEKGIVEIELRDKEDEIVANCIVDLDDWEILREYVWSIVKGNYKSLPYVATGHSHKTESLPSTHHRIHRKIMNAEVGQIVDHINGDTMDNRKENLRIVDASQSGMNIGLQSNNTSGYSGVWFNTEKGKWTATIGYYNENFYLGSYERKEDAIKIRQDAEKIYFGEYKRGHVRV